MGQVKGKSRKYPIDPPSIDGVMVVEVVVVVVILAVMVVLVVVAVLLINLSRADTSLCSYTTHSQSLVDNRVSTLSCAGCCMLGTLPLHYCHLFTKVIYPG